MEDRDSNIAKSLGGSVIGIPGPRASGQMADGTFGYSTESLFFRFTPVKLPNAVKHEFCVHLLHNKHKSGCYSLQKTLTTHAMINYNGSAVLEN